MLNTKPTSPLPAKKPIHRIPDKVLLADLTRVAAELGKKQLAMNEYRVHGEFHYKTFLTRFGCWSNAMRRAGCEPARRQNVPPEAVLHDIRRVAAELGSHKFSYNQYTRLGKYGAKPIINHFKTWQRAIIAAGFECVHKREIVPQPDRGNRIPTLPMRYAVLRRDHFKCVLCGQSPANDPTITLEIDHIIPWSKGGSSAIENLRTLCDRCNRGKSDSPATSDPAVVGDNLLDKRTLSADN